MNSPVREFPGSSGEVSYVSSVGSFNRTYGTLAGLVIFLLYFYFSAFFLLLGAEMNRILEEQAPGGKKAHGRPTSGKISGGNSNVTSNAGATHQ